MKVAPLFAIVIHIVSASTTTTLLSVRVNPDERAILQAAAAQSRTTLSEFMRRKALEAAETDVLNRVVVTIPAKDWERFEAWAARPAATIPALAELASLTLSWKPRRRRVRSPQTMGKANSIAAENPSICGCAAMPGSTASMARRV